MRSSDCVVDSTSPPKSDIPEARYLSPKQAAAYLGFTVRQLECWRALGRGPKYCKCGRHVRYPLQAIEDWMQSQLRNPRQNGTEVAR